MFCMRCKVIQMASNALTPLHVAGGTAFEADESSNWATGTLGSNILPWGLLKTIHSNSDIYWHMDTYGYMWTIHVICSVLICFDRFCSLCLSPMNQVETFVGYRRCLKVLNFRGEVLSCLQASHPITLKETRMEKVKKDWSRYKTI